MSIDFECPQCGAKMSGSVSNLQVKPSALELIKDTAKKYKIQREQEKQVAKIASLYNTDMPTAYRRLLAIGCEHQEEFATREVNEE